MINRIIGVVSLIIFITLTSTSVVPARGGFFFSFFHHRHYHRLFIPHYKIINRYIIETIPTSSSSMKEHDDEIFDQERRDRLRQIEETLDKLNKDLKEKSLIQLRLHQTPKF